MNAAQTSSARRVEAPALRYQSPTSQQTLAEALVEYRSSFDDLLDEAELTGRARELFHNHDIAHVVFGCDTSIAQEAMVDVWTIYGTTVSLRGYLAYTRLPEVRTLVKGVGALRTAWATIRALPALVTVIRRARRMHKQWPWSEHAEYLDRPLSEIRAEFGIHPIAR